MEGRIGTEEPRQVELLRQPNWAGREGHAWERVALKSIAVAKTGSLQITNHKAGRCMNQSQGHCGGKIF